MKKAFTLIELLVVIAIIAILAAILFPVFARAREKARQTSCLSNEKQLGLGFAQYETDYDETPPNGIYQYSPGGGGWAGQIYPYVKSVDVYRCPDDATGVGRFVSYGVNGDMGYAVAPAYAYPFSSYPISKYTAVASTVLLFEVAGSIQHTTYDTYDVSLPNEGNGIYGGSPFGNGIASTYMPNGASVINTCPPAVGATLVYATGYLGGVTPDPTLACHWLASTGRHTDGSNFLMADVHAKWLRGDSVSPGTSAVNPTDAQNAASNIAAGTSGTINGKPATATFSIQ